MKRLIPMLLFFIASFSMAQDHVEHIDQDAATRAVGVWLPTEPGHCTKEMHDRYSFTDPDTGEITTTWHEEVDSTGCRYGHSHEDQYTVHVPTVIPDPIKNSMAMGLWKPSPDTFLHPNECTQEEHDSYNHVFEYLEGQPPKRFPIWHAPVHVRFPAVEASETSPAVPAVTCNFGHDHGHDPSTSPLHDPVNPICFGCVNEAMISGTIMMPRHEDHVGHKIIVAEQPFGYSGSAEQLVCQTLTKLHQGTHSPDALTSNMHEVVKVFHCPGGIKARIQAMAAIGKAGWIESNADATDIYVGTPTPPDSPTTSNPHIGGDSLGDRDMPIAATVYAAKPNFFEQWRFQLCIMAIGEKSCSYRIADYWSVSNPSRFYDPEMPNKMARSIDVCWKKNTDGTYVVTTGNSRDQSPCAVVRRNNITDWRDQRSPLNGTIRGLRQDNFEWRNAGPEVVFTNPLGMQASAVPVPGVSEIRQEISVGSYLIPGTTRARVWVNRAQGGGVSGTSPVLTGVHAPN